MRDVPSCSRLIHPIPGELRKDQPALGAEEGVDLVKTRGEALYVMQRPTGHHSVERPRLREVLEGDTSEDGPLWCVGVDGRYIVSFLGHGPGQLPRTAAHFQNSRA